MKKLLSINAFLGISMFMFGVLKFIDPFKSWYTTQIENSGMGNNAYLLGIAGEIVVGVLLVYAAFWADHRKSSYSFIVILSSVLVIFMMAMGTYVHMHPAVPSDVLPLKIKPPFIPLAFLLLAGINIWQARKAIQN
ncbi:hypothetical protein LEPBI_I0131 [Sporocytophaga myxococcoides]|uniref:DoxX family protein n=1 Tax=Sporocytophaga myxococcoides TaxID=153721 RepID=A0A098LG90_9BACT|nr:hypothetical protein [Sporocytophaga myxococcoides]GAL85996.1 hypothetical protein LEPBI_I0131 [Sporocytophaga myxococcoides]